MGQSTSKKYEPPVFVTAGNKDDFNTSVLVHSESITSERSKSSSRAKQKNFRKALSSYVKKRKKSNISAAFSVLETTHDEIQLINVNTATEEELMTLAGVTRSIAQNIVKYRRMINGFRQIEDLALVPGIGADKLFKFSNEICVSNNKSSSYTSSLTPSNDSLPSNCSTQPGSPIRTYNINTASIFDLMNVQGLDQKLAASIVCYREIKGPFKAVDDLMKVKGFCPQKLGPIKFFLTVDDCDGHQNHRSQPVINLLGHRRTISAPVKLSEVGLSCGTSNFSYEDNSDIFEILSSRTGRPILEELFMDIRNGKPAFRLGSWDLLEACESKVENPGVREVICRTILENGLSIMAVQDASSSGVKQICVELNRPVLLQIKQWEGSLGNWRCHFIDSISLDDNHACGFIYDSSRNILLKEPLVFSEFESLYFVCVYGSIFMVNDLEIIVITFKLPSMKSEDVKSLFEKLTETIDCRYPGKNVVLCGSTYLSCVNEAFSTLNQKGYRSLLSPSFTTNLGTKAGVKYYDNFWINTPLSSKFTRHCGAIRQGLRHLAIPNGWGWGGNASDHVPIWCEFYEGEVPTDRVNGLIDDLARPVFY